MEVVQELHHAVAKACEASFDNAYRQLRTQLETQTKEAATKHEGAVEAQRKADSTIEDLRHDITLLQSELKQYEVDSQNLELPRQYASLEAEFDPKNLWGDSLEGKHFDSRKARERFERKYTALYTNLQTFLQSWGDLKRQVRRHREKLQQWDQQLKGDEFTLLLGGRKVRYRKVQGSGPYGLDKMDSQTNRRSLGKRSREEDPDLPAKLLKPSPKQTPRGDVEAAVNAKDNYPADDSLASELASTQSSSPGSQMEHPGSSDTTRPVYNRTIKQEREASSPPLPRLSGLHTQRNGPSTKRPVQTKREIMSSSPIRTSSYLGNQPYVGTQDLDDIGDTVPTPTKRKAHRDVHETNSESLEGGNHADHSLQTPPGQKVNEQSSALQAIDGNAYTPKIAHRRPSAKRLEDLERRAIPAMAEDGENLASVRDPLHTGPGTNRGPPEAKTPSTIVQRRLDDLLERSTPTKSLLRSAKSGPGSNSKQADAIPQHDHLTSTTSGETVPDVDPDDEPYRAMPLSVLGLKHFKINPDRNEGLDFAYNSVVRKRDDRKCISGCTRPGCCGDRFRAMARLGGLPGKSGVEQKQEDDELLREFVGENTQLLVTLSDKEREDLLVEARARALANQYGRHRHTHQRAQSPPGFWRTDMPSTQEEELDREAAKVLEREKIEERYREAMRPGGLWMFADE